jgi:hypothetical protein
MVNVKEIQRVLELNFTIKGEFDRDVQIDPHTGVVNTKCGVDLTSDVEELPVQFGQVLGNFSCADGVLKTLKGAPHHVAGRFACEMNNLDRLDHAPVFVGGVFSASYNQITHLTHLPQHVGGSCWIYSNPLQSLEGLEKLGQVGGELWLDYSDQLPLLRTVFTPKYHLGDGDIRLPLELNSIIQKYAGRGKSVMLNLANELKKAGFVENARW